jgi:hypothetical protein
MIYVEDATISCAPKASVVDRNFCVTDPDPTFRRVSDPYQDPILKSSGSDFEYDPKYFSIVFKWRLKHTLKIKIPAVNLVPVPVFYNGQNYEIADTPFLDGFY